ncbi:MAG TPA: FtsW/RodA/SpoVE family cell cycle protein [Candidatus Paenibacillus intestinavium]|nr:FtsW/RodA/SpoVE family cell cycle protein [Candidatus Paenibacillus intestinavium]
MHSTNQHVQHFIQGVCKEVRFKSIHEHITRELLDHIEDQKNKYIDQGIDEETANLKAVEQMGDPAIVGKQLDKTHRPKTDWSILSMAAILVVLGGLFQYIFSGVNKYSINMFSDFLQYAPIGIAAFAIMYFFDYRWLGRYSKVAYFVVFVIAAAGFLTSSKINGTYQHVYYTTLICIPLFAGIIYGFRNKGYLGIVFSGLFYAGVALLCISAPSFSALALLTISCLIILTVAIAKGFFGGNKKLSYVLVYVPTFLLSILANFIAKSRNPYLVERIVERITMIFNPVQDPSGSWYQLFMVRKLVSAARPIGMATLEDKIETIGIDRILPMWSTDLLLTYIIARFGYISGIAVIVLLLILIFRMFVSVLKQKNAYGFLVSFAACLALTGQIVLYVLANIGVMAPMSVTLPFVSFGGIGFLVNIVLLGLILSVYRRTDVVHERLPSNL